MNIQVEITQKHKDTFKKLSDKQKEGVQATVGKLGHADAIIHYNEKIEKPLSLEMAKVLADIGYLLSFKGISCSREDVFKENSLLAKRIGSVGGFVQNEVEPANEEFLNFHNDLKNFDEEASYLLKQLPETLAKVRTQMRLGEMHYKLEQLEN